MNDVLTKLAAELAVAATKVFKTKSLLPEAVLSNGSVSFLRPKPTTTADDTAAAYPPAISEFVYLHELFLL